MDTFDRVKTVTVDTAISVPVGILLGIILQQAKLMEWWAIITCSVLIVVPILALRWGKRLDERIRKGKQLAIKTGFFLEPIKTIPTESDSQETWSSWTRKIEALFRGRGLKRKADVLSRLIEKADSSIRSEVAENFFRGSAQEAIENIDNSPV